MTKRTVTVLALVIASGAIGGCVERELMITSSPPGALVYLADEEIGRTPLAVPFTWYGDYEVILRLEGHTTLKTHTPIRAPWYDIPPWDLVSQAFVPWTYHYKVQRHWQLDAKPLPTDAEFLRRDTELTDRDAELIDRATELRARNSIPQP